MKKILDEINIFKMIKEDVKKFPITMIIIGMLTLSLFGCFIASAANNGSEMFYTIFRILTVIVSNLPPFLLVAFITEYNKNSKGKGSIKNVLPYSIFVITKVLILLFMYAFAGDDPRSEFSKQMSIVMGIEIFWLGIYNIPKIIYKICIQERKKEKTIITLLKCALAFVIGFIYPFCVGIPIISYIIKNILV